MQEGLRHFEQSITQLDDGRLVCTAWEFHEEAGESRPNPCATLAPGGEQFSAPALSGLNGETCKLIALDGDRVLALYRRTDAAGLWGAVVSVGDDPAQPWTLLAHEPLCAHPQPEPPWVQVLSVASGACPGQGSAANTVGGEGSDGTVDTLSQLKFGYPTMVALENGEILCSFWCFEDDVYCIRYLRLAVS